MSPPFVGCSWARLWWFTKVMTFSFSWRVLFALNDLGVIQLDRRDVMGMLATCDKLEEESTKLKGVDE